MRLCKGLITQNTLISMVEKMLLACNKREICGAILTNFSRAFDYISIDLLIAKLHAYGSDLNALKVIHNYLPKRWETTQVDSSFRDFLDIYVVPQGLLLRLILFNINLCDLLLSQDRSEFTNFADDTTTCEYGKSYDDVIIRLEW